MIIKIAKGLQNDNVSIIRNNGSTDATVFPKKGPTSHDAIHYFVEKGLGLDHAFWGMIAKGSDFEEIQTIAKNAGHASAARAGQPEQHIVELLQAERLVECFEAEQWAPPVGQRNIHCDSGSSVRYVTGSFATSAFRAVRYTA